MFDSLHKYGESPRERGGSNPIFLVARQILEPRHRIFGSLAFFRAGFSEKAGIFPRSKLLIFSMILCVGSMIEMSRKTQASS